MNRIHDLLSQLSPGDVEYKTLGEILKIDNSRHRVSKDYYVDEGAYPIVDQSQELIAGYTNRTDCLYQTIPCIVFGDHTRAVKYVDFQAAQGDSGTKAFVTKLDSVNLKYVYYAMQNLKIRSRGYNRHWSIVKKMTIALPPLEVQDEIVRILDEYTTANADLHKKLNTEYEGRNKQFEYYKQALLSESRLNEMSEGKVESKPLQELIKFNTANKMIPKKGYLSEGKYPVIDQSKELIAGYTNEDEALFPNLPCIIFGEHTRIVKYVDFQAAQASSGAISLVLQDDSVNIKYLYYAMSCMKIGSRGYNRHWNLARKAEILIPPREVQDEIVRMLDQYCDLNTGILDKLSYEMAARQKEYEYYRNMLLTFELGE